MKERTSETIFVGKDAYLFLDEVSRKQRGCKPLTDEQKDRIWKCVSRGDGKCQLDDNSMGGGDGTYDGKWWGWNVDTLKKMLGDAGFDYESGTPIKYILV